MLAAVPTSPALPPADIAQAFVPSNLGAYLTGMTMVYGRLLQTLSTNPAGGHQTLRINLIPETRAAKQKLNVKTADAWNRRYVCLS